MIPAKLKTQQPEYKNIRQEYILPTQIAQDAIKVIILKTITIPAITYIIIFTTSTNFY
jgi:hypothetical protein